MIFLPDAHLSLSPHFNERPDNISVDLLVIHNISLPPGQFGGNEIEEFFLGRLDSRQHPFFESIRDLKVSSHFLIRRDGELVQFVDCEKRAWHAGISSWRGRENCNDFSIGIELEGTDDIEYEPEQYQKLVDVTRSLMSIYPAITLDNIVGHSDIAPGRKTDPGPAFDWQKYRILLSRRLNR